MTTREDKTQHEKLKEIADLIGYKEKRYEYLENTEDNMFYNLNTWFCFYDKWTDTHYSIDVREIIFTQEFMDRYINYSEKHWIIAPSKYKTFLIDLHKNLDNLVDYLYNTLWLWK